MVAATVLIGVGFCNSHMLSFWSRNHVSEQYAFCIFCKTSFKIDDKWKEPINQIVNENSEN